MREDMIRTIEYHVQATAHEIGRDHLNPLVIKAMRNVPRDRFVPLGEQRFAWSDSPLPIGHGQTISQPFIVALMTDLIEPRPDHTVLEVGTGCGYQAAVLAEIVKQVYGIEIVEPLAARAARLLKELGYANVEIRAGDGYHGWPEHAPYDGIVVTAAGVGVPEPLKQQLKIGGKLVLPVEDAAGWQNLDVIERTGENTFETRHTIGVRFVPLTGEH